jgi:hypothetical protein
VIRLFKHYVPHTVLLLGLIDLAVLILAAEGGWLLRIWQIGGDFTPSPGRIPEILTYALTLQVAMVGVGVYAIDALWSMRIAVARLVVSISLAVLLLAFIFFMVPALEFWRSNLFYAMIFSLVGLVAVRLMLGKTLDASAFKRRVLILGAGPARGAGGAIGGAQRRQLHGGRLRRDERWRARRSAGGQPLQDPQPFRSCGEAWRQRGRARPRGAAERAAAGGSAESQDGGRQRQRAFLLPRARNRASRSRQPQSQLADLLGRLLGGRRISSAGKRLFDIIVSATILILMSPLILITAVAVKLESPGRHSSASAGSAFTASSSRS